MIDVVALRELLIDFTCLSHLTMAAHPGGISSVPELSQVKEKVTLL